ncbi:glyoxalase [Nitriliruptor alkaliphilus]|uniref:glyoxalase n=1 Tax=Nitriliruptor alkaliphilus TaxID=427918 RepID=UPI0014701B9D|nr:glyoxalase [Nitriliruptor alkaliphilus]
MRGPTLTGLAIGDDPAAWRALGLPVTGDRLTVGGVTIRLAGSHGRRGVLGWQLDPPAPDDVDGLGPADAGGPPPTSAAEVTTGYSVVAVDHLVVATPNLRRTTAALGTIGLTPRRTVDAVRGDGGVRYRFFLLGTCVLELIGPTEPAGDAPAIFGGLALTAPDLDVFTEVMAPPRAAVQPGRRIVTLRTEDHDVSVPIAVLSPRPSTD